MPKNVGRVALRKESVDRNPGFAKFAYGRIKSLSARRAWIEIVGGTVTANPIFPSLSARRAWIEIVVPSLVVVWSSVALRKESVDRNKQYQAAHRRPNVSLSARRAWIEIPFVQPDRGRPASLSARRAWIEMMLLVCLSLLPLVALRKESVDRNAPAAQFHRGRWRRSPQGERG